MGNQLFKDFGSFKHFLKLWSGLESTRASIRAFQKTLSVVCQPKDLNSRFPIIRVTRENTVKHMREYLTRNNSKTVRLSRALIGEIEDISNSLEIGTVNDCLNLFMREIGHGLRKTRSRHKEKGSKYNVNFVLTDTSVTISFSEKVKEE